MTYHRAPWWAWTIVVALVIACVVLSAGWGQ